MNVSSRYVYHACCFSLVYLYNVLGIMLTSSLSFVLQSGKYDTPSWLSEESKELISFMLQVDPKRRVTINQLVEHPWLMEGVDIPVEWNSKYRVVYLGLSWKDTFIHTSNSEELLAVYINYPFIVVIHSCITYIPAVRNWFCTANCPLNCFRRIFIV